jgi:hypothetical protein
MGPERTRALLAQRQLMYAYSGEGKGMRRMRRTLWVFLKVLLPLVATRGNITVERFGHCVLEMLNLGTAQHVRFSVAAPALKATTTTQIRCG